ncbi:MAG TPA: CPXCG motif-containing cysteine-rich protein [Woeseiaceae bacterium]|nr:CPXCG motif-containing cysteine-rich protein [Woeseiaceae bacterium]
MEAAIIERRIACPYCAESMDVVLDLSAGSQSYIEDCEVCCQPMQISFDADGNELRGLQVDRA